MRKKPSLPHSPSAFNKDHNTFMNSIQRIALLSTFLMAATGAHAVETETANLNIKVKITATCKISTSEVNFDTVDSSATDVAAQGSLQVNCTSGTDYAIALNDGANADGSTRRMVKGTDHVAYELYKDSARTERWESATGTGTGVQQTLLVYGKIASANSPAGDYSDVVTATVTY